MPLSYPLSRRRFLAGIGAASTGFIGPALLSADGRTAPVSTGPAVGRPLPTGLFQLGVASGDPLPDGILLWTRLAPRPLEGGGMPPQPVPVVWEVALDELFSLIVREGLIVAHPASAHSVHADIRGLEPGTSYFYRFRAGNEASPVGRTRTAPAPSAKPTRLRFALASCQNWQDGYFNAYKSLAECDLDFVAFVGDYIYEVAPWPGLLREHVGIGEARTLADYRNRYAQYRTDPLLAAMHAAAPWIATWDDHEVDDNWAGDIPADPKRQSHAEFHARRAAATQAYYEHMPIRARAPHDTDFRLYRRLRFGDLATVHVLDTRQYRSPHPTRLSEAYAPWRTMTGRPQERWLLEGMAQSSSRWNLLANQVMMAQSDRTPGPKQNFSWDSWDGYRVQRARLMDYFGSGATRNPVVLTGDQHATWVCDLKPDFDSDTSPVVAAELTGTSITSGGDSDLAKFHREHDQLMAESPHWKYIDDRRGYLLCELTPEALHATLRVVDTVRSPSGGQVRTAARFVVESDRPGVALDGAPNPPLTIRTTEGPAPAR
jgi:alkaline phosphatase D